MYLLLDANVVAGFYLPRSLGSLPARGRIRLLLDAVRGRRLDHVLLMPTFCIAETFGVFAKHSFGRWNPQLKTRRTIDSRVYASLVKQFSKDIHNGRLINQYELSRYHILGVDLIAPVDHHYQITRQKQSPAGTFDHLILAMGIQLVHLHGPAKVVIVTTDKRLVRLTRKCKSSLSAAVVKKLKLDRAKDLTGKRFSPEIFPMCIDLDKASDAELEEVLGEWPPPDGRVPEYYRWDQL